MEIKWVEKTGQFANGKNAMVGKWAVGSVDWNSMKSQGSNLNYSATIMLPGLKNNCGAFESEADARAKVANTIMGWFAMALGNL